VREIIERPGSVLHFSIAAIWEVATKRSLGWADFQTEAGALRAGLLQSGYVELPIEGRHVIGLAALPNHHRDPFDRLLVAQALGEGMALLSSDKRVAGYSDAIRLV
jgi:PIN domain nuclease of toxin-antitoxin system